MLKVIERFPQCSTLAAGPTDASARGPRFHMGLSSSLSILAMHLRMGSQPRKAQFGCVHIVVAILLVR